MEAFEDKARDDYVFRIPRAIFNEIPQKTYQRIIDTLAAEYCEKMRDEVLNSINKDDVVSGATRHAQEEIGESMSKFIKDNLNK